MIEKTNNTQGIYFPERNNNYASAGRGLLNFDVEDRAIISAKAKILNELEKFNAGEGNEIELAMASIMGRVEVEAAINVIKTKEEMIDVVMKITDFEN